jgi:hypothetical protein
LGGRQSGLPILFPGLGDRLLGCQLIGRQQVVDRVARRLHEPGEDVGRVVELHDLRERLDHLLFVIPLVVGGILIGEARGPRLVDRVEEQVVLVVVDQLDRTDLPQPLAIGVHEAPQLLGRLVQEVATLELRLLGELSQRGDAW